MKVRVISDLHLECCENNHGVPNLGEGNVLILGGDILCARHFKKNGPLKKVYNDFLQKCVSNFSLVNHQFLWTTYISISNLDLP